MIRVRITRQSAEGGFTLIEVLVTTLILGMIASSVAVAIVLFFRTADGTTSRLSLSHDSQLLASYLIPDLDNMTCPPSSTAQSCGTQPGQPTWLPPSPGQLDCPNNFVSITDLSIQYVDGSTKYSSLYHVNLNTHQLEMTRTVSNAGNSMTKIVVHSLKFDPAPPPKPFSSVCLKLMPSGPPWTLYLKTGSPGSKDDKADYNFSLTGGGRVPRGPRLCVAPCQPLVAKDLTGDGVVDEIDATFDQSLDALNGGPVSQWVFSPPLTNLVPTGVSVSGNVAKLTLQNNGSVPDTSQPTFSIALNPDPNGLRGDPSQTNGTAASFSPTRADDGMSPIVVDLSSTNIAGGDRGLMEQGDKLNLTFSEPLLASSLPQNPDITLTAGSGNTNDQLSISNVATIDLGDAHAYISGSRAKFHSTAALNDNGTSVILTVGPPISGADNVNQARSSTKMTVTPMSGPVDRVGHPVVGKFTTPVLIVLF